MVAMSTPGTPWEPLDPSYARVPQGRMEGWGTQEVAAWALGVNFGSHRSEYASKLVAMGIEGADLIALGGLPEEEARECLVELGIHHPLHQRKLLRDVGANATRSVPVIGTPR